MSMTRRTWLGLLALVAAVTVAGTPAGAQQTQKPNVVFILADNVGYGDLGAYGGGELRGAPTPTIDQLAREGLRLTQFLVEPACTPSRAALMTGQYSIRSGLSLIAIEGSPNTLSAQPSLWARRSKVLVTPRQFSASGTLEASHKAFRLRMASTSFTAFRRTFPGMRQLTSTQWS